MFKGIVHVPRVRHLDGAAVAVVVVKTKKHGRNTVIFLSSTTDDDDDRLRLQYIGMTCGVHN